jgi:hypothetical protein
VITAWSDAVNIVRLDRRNYFNDVGKDLMKNNSVGLRGYLVACYQIIVILR